MTFRCHLLATQEEFREAELLQRSVWGFADREIIPLNELVVAQRNGGFVFGAFDKDNRMVAFCFGVPGLKDGEPYHYSRMLGVIPAYQDKGLGYQMKLFQRQQVLKQGLSLIRWTFDPLQSRNAFFNIEKLGAIIREYVINMYGADSSSRFNAGLETDRFVPEWHVRSRRVEERLHHPLRPPSIEQLLGGIGVAPGLEAVFNKEGLLEPDTVRVNVKAKQVYAEVPDSIDEIKAQSVELAQRWRFETRKFLSQAVRRGYVVAGFAVGRVGKHERRAYLLEKDFRFR